MMCEPENQNQHVGCGPYHLTYEDCEAPLVMQLFHPDNDNSMPGNDPTNPFYGPERLEILDAISLARTVTVVECRPSACLGKRRFCLDSEELEQKSESYRNIKSPPASTLDQS
eukprot:scaffold630_cov174-Amphora_coffeaeformis.AAC.14